MMRSLYKLLIILLCLGSFLTASDTLKIAPCDDAVAGIFGDMICLSKDEGALRRYVDGKLTDSYSGTDAASELMLQEPKRPVLDGTDNIYILDTGTNSVLGWDRFLNLRSITRLHDDILSPRSFTVTSEHDWLIYDEFFGQILQVHPGQNFYTSWGDRTIKGDIDLFSIADRVIVYVKDNGTLRICDSDGTTLRDLVLPDSLMIERIFPLTPQVFALSAKNGVYIWKPGDRSLRYLSDLKHVVLCTKNATSYILVDQEGTVVTIP